ncbi:MAG TPA: N-6 DNA methylase [Solirubrobacterales bacterium]|nr:N-6 DNA methylase [Solirubrobacterales bacterium]
MDLALRKALKAAIEANPDGTKVVREIAMDEDGSGFVEYEASGLSIHPSAPGFTGTRTAIGDEELVRAYLLVKLVGQLAYPAGEDTLLLEEVYKAVGRPGKGGRVDILVRKPPKKQLGDAFLFIECKAPSEYDHEIKYIDGQLFRLSRQEVPRPKYLVYFTVELKEGSLHERSIIIDTALHDDYGAWDDAGQPLIDVLPTAYGKALKRRFGNVESPTSKLQPLDKAVTPETFARLRTELHDVIWGGGGTNNNEVFVYITKLILAKIFDEQLTGPDKPYRFQRLGDAVTPESPQALTKRLNAMYKEAETSYLALPEATEGPAFDTARISAEKLAFVVGRLEGLSITENVHPGDLLGEFFEQIVAQDFTQSKGQFFTPMKLIRFMLELSEAVEGAKQSMLTKLDANGRPLLPFMIDPSCGAGSFLIEYMRQVRAGLADPAVRSQLAPRLRDYHNQWFGGSGNRWAQTFLFGVENNYDLGLASKVNMVLHSDGSMNTWIASGLAPFDEYILEGRSNVLGSTQSADPSDGRYTGPLNEQFDLVVSNPPFSLTFPEDELKKVRETFVELPVGVSEALFIERWYQLLRAGGRFCCIVPESILDTSRNISIRRFLIEHFKLQAVVSLPYDAFRPFTSTKTAIVLAEKRTPDEISAWKTEYRQVKKKAPAEDEHQRIAAVLDRLGWADEEVFMAEPQSVGYKRRKGLPDLPRPNDLEDEDGTGGDSVLERWQDPSRTPDPRFGFRTTLSKVASRTGLRLDPKYRWLWDFQNGHVMGDPDKARPLRDYLKIVRLGKTEKGTLDQETSVVDLEYVEGRQAFLSSEVPTLDEIGSDKVSFRGAELLFSKLEPYLGKIVIEPGQDDLGTTEWIGLKRLDETPLLVVAYLLLLPEMREAYRRLQAGKRHARLNPPELLDLKVQMPKGPSAAKIEKQLAKQRAAILELRAEGLSIREEMDAAFEPILGDQAGRSAPSPPLLP